MEQSLWPVVSPSPPLQACKQQKILKNTVVIWIFSIKTPKHNYRFIDEWVFQNILWFQYLPCVFWSDYPMGYTCLFKWMFDSFMKISIRWSLSNLSPSSVLPDSEARNAFGSGSSLVWRSRPSAATQPVTPADFDVQSNTTHWENWICPFITAAAHAELIRFWQNFVEKWISPGFSIII